MIHWPSVRSSDMSTKHFVTQHLFLLLLLLLLLWVEAELVPGVDTEFSTKAGYKFSGTEEDQAIIVNEQYLLVGGRGSYDLCKSHLSPELVKQSLNKLCNFRRRHIPLLMGAVATLCVVTCAFLIIPALPSTSTVRYFTNILSLVKI